MIFFPFEGDQTAKKIVTHSFGLHLIPTDLLQECEELTILSGFLKLNEKVKLRAMRMSLKENPAALLQAFYSEAGYTGAAPWLNLIIDVETLHQDLLCMEKGMDIEPFLSIPKVSIWQANNDRIILDQGAALAAYFPDADVVTVEGGHMATLERWKEKQQLSGPLAEPPQVMETTRYFKKR